MKKKFQQRKNVVQNKLFNDQIYDISKIELKIKE